MEARVFVFVTGCRLIVVATVLLLAMPATAQPALPVIGTILENRGAIGLAASQVEALKRLSLDFIRLELSGAVGPGAGDAPVAAAPCSRENDK